jgi:hypothetical protein
MTNEIQPHPLNLNVNITTDLERILISALIEIHNRLKEECSQTSSTWNSNQIFKMCANTLKILNIQPGE